MWVVDGVILEQDVPITASELNSEDAEYLVGNAISGISPQDIESITVLKDASATAILWGKSCERSDRVDDEKRNCWKTDCFISW